jgi:hypothetical protein
MPQFGASLADDSRVVIYDCNMFIVQATGCTNDSPNIFIVEARTLQKWIYNLKKKKSYQGYRLSHFNKSLFVEKNKSLKTKKQI